jgi:hypothetical protein
MHYIFSATSIELSSGSFTFYAIVTLNVVPSVLIYPLWGLAARGSFLNIALSWLRVGIRKLCTLVAVRGRLNWVRPT